MPPLGAGSGKKKLKLIFLLLTLSTWQFTVRTSAAKRATELKPSAAWNICLSAHTHRHRRAFNICSLKKKYWGHKASILKWHGDLWAEVKFVETVICCDLQHVATVG